MKRIEGEKKNKIERSTKEMERKRQRERERESERERLNSGSV